MVEIKVKPELLQETYLRAITRGKLSNREYSILSECCRYKVISTEERKEIQKKLGISQFSFNNVVSKFKDTYFVKRDDNTLLVPAILRVLGESITVKFKANE